MKLHHRIAGFASGELVIVILVIGAIVGTGGYVYSQVSSGKSAKQTKTPVQTGSGPTFTPPSAGDPSWSEYQNGDYGFRFKYPPAWGTVSITRKALNDSKYEPSLPYVVSFRSKEAPRAWIIPSDWKTTSTQTNVRQPLTVEQLMEGASVRQIAQDPSKSVAIVYSAQRGIQLLGLKSEVIPKINGAEVEFTQGESYSDGNTLAPKKTCLSQITTDAPATYPGLECYPESYRNDFMQFVDSFSSI
jgi:hypothetical protein